MGGWRRLSAEGKRRHKKLFEPARHSAQHTLPASFFCAGDTLPFLAIFSKALIFFCYFFCIKAKKVNRVSQASLQKTLSSLTLSHMRPDRKLIISEILAMYKSDTIYVVEYNHVKRY
jgi:hypothetical protein